VFERVTMQASDLERSRAFYDTVLAPLGLGLRRSGDNAYACGELELVQAGDERVTRALHLAFLAASHDEVDAFWQAGVDAGHPSDGRPGLRPEYAEDYYGAFLLDPYGNSAEAVAFDRLREGEGVIDHLWIRVADLAATRRFCDVVAPILGLRIAGERPERFHLAAGGRSYALVRGDPVTKSLRLTFPAPVVEELRLAAAAAGYAEADGGVVDPDGTVIAAIPSR
jgi:catechol 2,3-dioxygenase-like lactoylglutathione lyase family enzyme